MIHFIYRFLASLLLLGISVLAQAQDNWGNTEYRGKPWVKNISIPYSIEKGLQNKHLTVSSSHGIYWKNDKHEWGWQRPPLYGTTEDLFTQTIVVPFLIPMLERAGAIVYSPRERDWQKNEIIVDNDTKELGYSEENGQWNWQLGEYVGFANPKQIYVDEENPFIMGSARVCGTVNHKSNESLAIWNPEIPEKGKYAVYVTYQSFLESANDALYTVYHAGGTTEFHVNQGIGGGTWTYLGTFEFNAGKTPEGKVTLSNYTTGNGGVVVADAVRFGGGMGNIGRGENHTTSGMPRYLEGARYSTQWAGFPYDAYSSYKGERDYNDDINSRSFATNHLNGGSIFNPDTMGLRVPIEMQFSVHSDAGYTEDNSWVGSMTICSTENDSLTNYPGGISRQASKNLATKLLLGLTRDLNNEYELNWTGREIRDRNYSESKRAVVPSVIFETLSHQNFADIKLGHDPNFKFTAARSMYKSITRFINEVHQKETVIAPLPIHAFAIQFGKMPHEVKLSWEPTNDKSESSAVPNAFVIYTRIENGGFDNGRVVKGNHINLSLTPGLIYSFKITAINQGGESMDSEILTAYIANNASADRRILIVNGFERLSGPQPIDTETLLGFDINSDIGVPYKYTPGYCGAQIIFDRTKLGDETKEGCGYSGNELEGKLIAGNTFDYPYIHGTAIAANGNYSFVSCSKEAVEKGLIDLKQYSMMDLIFGLQKNDGWSLKPYKTFTPELMSKIQTYLQNGGNLLVSGSFIASDMKTIEEQKFIINYLKYSLDEPLLPTQEEQSFINGCGMKIYIPRKLNEQQYAVQMADCLRPEGTSFPAFAYNENSRCAGIAYQGRDYHLMAMGFPFESICNEQDRSKIMGAILQFLLK